MYRMRLYIEIGKYYEINNERKKDIEIEHGIYASFYAYQVALEKNVSIFIAD